MDQSIAGFATEAPRRFLRDWVQTVLWPGLGCGGFAVAVVSDDLQFEDWIFIFILGTPVVYWLVVGLLQARVLRSLIERPRVWAVSTWGGGSLALVAGFAVFAWLTIWIDAVSHAGFDPEHPVAFALFALSGAVAGLVLGFLQAITMRATWRERVTWLAWSAGSGAVAFLVLWAGVNALAFMSDQGTIDVTETAFFATIAGFLLAGALAHNLLTGIALQRMLAKRARQNQDALVGQFD